MKLKKLVLAAFVIMAVSLVMTGCPMTAKDYKKAEHELDAERAKLYYEDGIKDVYLGAIKNLVMMIHPTKDGSNHIPYEDKSNPYSASIKQNLKSINERFELNTTQKRYGVTQKEIVFTGNKEKGIERDTYKGKTEDEVAEALKKLFEIKNKQ